MDFDPSVLRARLIDFDGRAISLLGETEAAFGKSLGYVDALVTLSSDPQSQVSNGATWLLKSFLEAGGALTDGQVNSFVSQAHNVHDWTAVLHVCQSVRWLKIGAADADMLCRWLTPNLSHDRPFVRAWALDAVCALTRQHSRFADIARAAVAAASTDPAGSVRARARNIEPI